MEHVQVQVTPEPELVQDDLGVLIQEYVAMKNEMKEAQQALKVMRTASSNVLETIHKKMKTLNKKRLEVKGTGDIIVEQKRTVLRKPKVAELPAIYQEVLGAQLTQKLDEHIKSLTRTDIITCVIHRKVPVAGDDDDEHALDDAESSELETL